MSDDDHKDNVADLTLRRKVEHTDPVMLLADKITKLLADTAHDTTIVEQFVALELSARALAVTVEQVKGLAGLNELLVEAGTRQQQYSIDWPEHEARKTIYHFAEEEREADDRRATVIPFRRRDDDKNPSG